ncbi:glycosyltransferase family protein [Azospirillum halopraeferens]|uniref:glycosyltransferase family protein n=1 Tax=Azospirillum halopraeferens TaxID=34010 RepID=UPI000408C79B|nr:glycosyltransferase [Azospirillum halopraeferens]
MTERARPHRVLIYSHDTFGLGHLRRCLTIAHALVERHRDLSVLILSGSPIVGSFDFRTRVDFVRVPGVIKLRNGEYTALNLHMDIDEILHMRASLIRHTAKAFRPDLFIVDKEPLGLRGEVKETLEDLKDRGVPLVLGLRDVMDEPALLAPEWERKRVQPALEHLYDELWVYGLPRICDPLEGIDLSPAVRRKMVYTGYLRRTAPPPLPTSPDIPADPYILVTAGGGGDGEALIDWVLRAYEHDPAIPYRAMLVLGPFMQPERQAEFLARAAALPAVEATTFETRLESLMQAAVGVVAMGGYNTFCEILSFDKKALIVPRVTPRREQYIRASRAQELGLVAMLPDDDVRRPADMAAALRRLPLQAPPSSVVVPGLLDGLETVDRLAWHHLTRPERLRPPLTLLAGGL